MCRIIVVTDMSSWVRVIEEFAPICNLTFYDLRISLIGSWKNSSSRLIWLIGSYFGHHALFLMLVSQGQNVFFCFDGGACGWSLKTLSQGLRDLLKSAHNVMRMTLVCSISWHVGNNFITGGRYFINVSFILLSQSSKIKSKSKEILSDNYSYGWLNNGWRSLQINKFKSQWHFYGRKPLKFALKDIKIFVT